MGIGKILGLLKRKNPYKRFGKNVVIANDCEIGNPENVVIDDNVFIGEKCCIFAIGGVHIKSGSIIADRVDIRTANHYYDGDDLNYLPFDEKVIAKPVVIGENCWIASHALILPGVEIGEGSIVTAGSVVTKSVDPYSVVGGNPARVIKYRDKEKYKELERKGAIFMKEYHTIKREIIKK